MNKSLTSLAAAAIILVLAACRNAAPPTTPAGRHAVHSENLRKVMSSLALAQTDRLPQELDTDQEQQWRRSDAVRILGNIAESAARIPNVLGETSLTKSHQDEFRTLAGNLRAAALQLQQEIPVLKADEIGNRFQVLMQNCSACHDRFRSLPSLPDGL